MTIRVISSTQYYRVTNTGAVTMVLAGPVGPAGSGGGGGGDMTGEEILEALEDVDGANSGLDADLLDGNHAAAFALAGHNHSGVYQPVDADLTALAAANNSTVLAATTAAFLTADETKLDGIEAGAEVNDTASEILAKLVTVDGSGSGLDADLLDGQSSAAFAAASHAHAISDVTGLQTAIDGKQPLDADLTTLATAFATASASGPATLAFHEDTDNGSNKITVSAPASVGSDATVTLPGAAGLLVLGTGGSGGNAAGLWIGTTAEYAGLSPSATTVYIVTS